MARSPDVGRPGHNSGKTAFVPFVLPGEEVDASVIEEKPGFIRANVETILLASPQRVEAPCPYLAPIE